MMTKLHYDIVCNRMVRRLSSLQQNLNPSSNAYIIAHAMFRNLARDLAEDFAAQDPKFDRARFLIGCGLTQTEIDMPREV